MSAELEVTPRVRPVLDPGFLPAVLWNRAYRRLVEESGGGVPFAVALQRPDGVCFHHQTRVLPDADPRLALTRTYVERLLKFLLWQKGGSRVWVAGSESLAAWLGEVYRAGGKRSFDAETVGGRMFLEPLRVEARPLSELPAAHEPTLALGRHLDGCRIGFDLGGSDRKCAALIDGKVVFSEEVPWNPYCEKNPQYHLDGIQDSLRRAAAHLPRVDAIGGSAAGVYVNNEVRVASLFRGVPAEEFERRVRRLFLDLRHAWNDVPFEVVNDGEVTALAGSMSLNDHAVLGISMGTSEAAGYCDAAGHITVWLNELAFAPVDYREDGPRDEWSGDFGCGVQFFSQQGVARLAAAAGLDYPAGMPMAERLVDVQRKLAAGDPRAVPVYETIGDCFGYAVAHYADFYELRHVLALGRVTSGPGGEILLQRAREVLRKEFPELAERIRLSMPDEQMKRHGQAIAAASLPAVGGGGGPGMGVSGYRGIGVRE